MNEQSKPSRHPNGPEARTLPHRTDMTPNDPSGVEPAASVPVEDSYSAGSLYLPDVIYTDETLNRAPMRLDAAHPGDSRQDAKSGATSQKEVSTQPETHQASSRDASPVPASAEAVEPIRPIESEGESHAPSDAARMMDAIREIAALNRRIATQLLGAPSETSNSASGTSDPIASKQDTSDTTEETDYSLAAQHDHLVNSEPADSKPNTTHRRLDSVETPIEEETQPAEEQAASLSALSPTVAEAPLDNVDEWVVSIEDTSFSSSSIVVDVSNLDAISANSEAPTHPPKKTFRIDNAAAQVAPKPHLNASHLAMEAGPDGQLVIEEDSQPRGEESRWPTTEVQTDSIENSDLSQIKIRSAEPKEERSQIRVVGNPAAPVDPTEIKQNRPPLESPSDDSVSLNDVSVVESQTESLPPPPEAIAAEPSPIAESPVTMEPSTIRAAWEVDCFRWPEVTNRLLRDETDCFDTILESLQLGQRFDRRAVLISGAEPSEGRSTLAVCLARRSRSLGFRTLLVDADVRHGDLDQLAGLDFEMGWRCPEAGDRIEEGLVRCLMTNLVLMPLGKTAGSPNTPRVDYEHLWGALNSITPAFEIVILDGGIVPEIASDLPGSSEFLHTALLVQGTHEAQTAEVVKAYQSLKQLGIGSVAIAETTNRRMAG